MGSSPSKLTLEQLVELQKATSFNKKELQQWYKGFIKDCPSGTLDKGQFLGIYKQFFPFGDPSSFAEFVFGVFDQDKNGVIDFKEFIVALNVTSRGTLEDKLSWAFLLYDHDEDGFISRDEMVKIVDAIYKMIGSMVTLPPDENTPEKRVNKFFETIDKDKNDKISMDEFRAGTQKDPSIIQALSLTEGLI